MSKAYTINNFPSQAHVLLVDDDVSALDISKFILQQDGHTVTIASNGKDALILLNGSANSSNPIGLAITDLTMPGMSGVDLIAEIRKRGFSMPVVVTTVCIESYTEPEIQNMGADHILFKPFNPTDLTDCVKKILLGNYPGPRLLRRSGYAGQMGWKHPDVSSIAPCATEEGVQHHSPGSSPWDRGDWNRFNEGE